MRPADDTEKKGLYPLVRLAKETVESYIREGKVPEVSELTPGIFLSSKK